LALVAEQPDLTLVETVTELRKRRIRTSRSSLWRFLDRHGITLKKSLQAAERLRADVAQARRRWIREQGMLDPARLVFIDETAVSTNMVRLRGRAPRGVRLIGHVPLGTWETITFVAALRHDKMTAPIVIEGTMTGEMFSRLCRAVLGSDAPAQRHRRDGQLPSPHGSRYSGGN
jgi:hypothetical protein